MKFLILILALSVSSVAYAEKVAEFGKRPETYAENGIVGAFGVRLGDSIDERMELVEKLDHRWMLHPGTVYSFAPVNPHKYFTDYIVSVTPKTKVIYNISMISEYHKTVAECEKRRAEIAALLDSKYPKIRIEDMSTNDTFSPSVEDVLYLRWVSGEKSISLVCKSNLVLGVYYVDGYWMNQLDLETEQERKEKAFLEGQF